MRQLVFALALVGCSGSIAAPVAAEGVSDLAVARAQVEKMPEGRQKETAKRQLRMATAIRSGGDTEACLLQIGVSIAQPTAWP